MPISSAYARKRGMPQMLNNFNRDKEFGKTAEDLVFNLLSALGYDCENVAEQK